MSVIEELKVCEGNFKGHGINHENQVFFGTMTVGTIVDGSGIQIQFKAVGEDNTVYHEENSIIAMSSDGCIKMWNLNSNIPTMTELRLVSDQDHKYVFRLGDLNNFNSFREEIHIQVNGEKVAYHFHWGMPGGEFKYRSGLEMDRNEN